MGVAQIASTLINEDASLTEHGTLTCVEELKQDHGVGARAVLDIQLSADNERLLVFVTADEQRSQADRKLLEC
jgi:hypothetical protein